MQAACDPHKLTKFVWNFFFFSRPHHGGLHFPVWAEHKTFPVWIFHFSSREVQVGPALSENAQTEIILNPKNSQNHISIPAVLFCTLNQKFAQFEGFFSILFVRTKRDPPVQTYPLLRTMRIRTSSVWLLRTDLRHCPKALSNSGSFLTTNFDVMYIHREQSGRAVVWNVVWHWQTSEGTTLPQ